MTGTSTVWPANTTVSDPSKAGALVISPEALAMPETPSGSSPAVRASCTPSVCTSVSEAWASTSSGLLLSAASGFSSPEQAARLGTAKRAAVAAATNRERAGMTSAFHRAGHGVGRSVRASGDLAGDLERHRRGDRGDRLRRGYAGAVPPAGRLGQVDGGAAGCGGTGRSRSGPGVDQGVLALEEPVAAHAARGAALAGVLGERGDLDRPGLGALQRGRGAGRGHDDGVGGLEGAEERDLLAGAELDARHAAARAPLGSHAGRREVEELGVGRD